MSASPPYPFPSRITDGHKGTFGTVCVIGGLAAAPRIMIGGPALSALAALRTGCGLAVLAIPAPILNAGLSIAPSATGLALPVDRAGRLLPSDVAELLDQYLPSFHCIALGPGLGADEPQQQVVLRLAAQSDVPLVIDADALNCLASLRDFARDLRAPAVLTPHPGEFRRLAEALGLNADPLIPVNRPAAAQALAQRLGCVVVLKGPGTVITDGITTHVNATGNAALATAGTGDVLAGIIASLIAQFRSPAAASASSSASPALSLLQCAAIGAHLHGLAADRWAASHGHAGLLAIDLIDLLPYCLNELRK